MSLRTEWRDVRTSLPKSDKNVKLLVIDPETGQEEEAHFYKGKFYWHFDHACFYPIQRTIRKWKLSKDD